MSKNTTTTQPGISNDDIRSLRSYGKRFAEGHFEDYSHESLEKAVELYSYAISDRERLRIQAEFLEGARNHAMNMAVYDTIEVKWRNAIRDLES